MSKKAMQAWVLGVVAMASGCSAADPLEDESTGIGASGVTVTPLDPVAACKASGLNVIIGTTNDDVINGTEQADCIAARGGQDRINGCPRRC